MKASVLIDCGTSYAKIHYLKDSKRDIISSRHFIKNLDQYDIVASTGHNKFHNTETKINELVALAEGGLEVIKDNDFTILDCGARDVKYIKVENRKVTGMDWNTECGAFTGQVIELLTGYFDIDPGNLPETDEKIPVVCGVLGMTQMFDLISQGITHEEAFARFLRGIAFNCETLVGRPEKLYLSGGLCENKAFVKSFSCDTIPLGRFLLLDGLIRFTKSSGIYFQGI
ncbi:MAG TPA: ATPase [bacterium]|nr:ATPase [bacterium]